MPVAEVSQQICNLFTIIVSYLHIFFRVLLCVKRLKMFDGGFVVRQLVCRVLRVLGHLEADVTRDRAFTWLQRASDEVQERRFTGTVLADDGNAGLHANL